jgi:uncharacterized protein (TIGR03000 family)
MFQKAFAFTGLLLLSGATALVTPGLGQAQSRGVADSRSVHITVRVPAGARVWIDGVPTTTTGTVREFDTPPLARWGRYYYEVTARWNERGREVTQRQHVEFGGREDVRVDFPIPPKVNGYPLDAPER